MSANLDDLAQLGVDALDGVGRGNRPTRFRQKCEEGDHPVLDVALDGADSPKFLPPTQFDEDIELGLCRLGTRGGTYPVMVAVSALRPFHVELSRLFRIRCPMQVCSEGVGKNCSHGVACLEAVRRSDQNILEHEITDRPSHSISPVTSEFVATSSNQYLLALRTSSHPALPDIYD